MHIAIEQCKGRPARQPVSQVGQIATEQRVRATLRTQQARHHTKQLIDVETQTIAFPHQQLLAPSKTESRTMLPLSDWCRPSFADTHHHQVAPRASPPARHLPPPPRRSTTPVDNA